MIKMSRFSEQEKQSIISKSELYKDLIIYRYDNQSTKPCVKIWRGKASSPFANYYFKDLEGRERLINAEKDNADKREVCATEKKAEKQLAKDSFINPFKIGDILYHSWGYDQTNIDYYQVVSLTAKSVTLRPIASKQTEATGWASANVIPAKDHFIKSHCALRRYSGEVSEITKQVSGNIYNGKMNYSIPTPYGHCGPWDGSPKHSSWYA